MTDGEFERLTEAQVEALGAVDPNEVGHHRQFGHAAPEISYLNTACSPTVVGTAVTVRVPPVDGAMVHRATESLQPGDVLVIDVGGHETNAVWGEITTHAAVARGARGVVVDGAVTDTAAIREIGFPVYARARTTRTVQRLEESLGGDVNVPVQAGGAVVEPGDVAIGNEDGVVFVPREAVDDVIDRYAGADGHEERLIELLYEGESLADLSGATARIEAREE